MPRAANTLASPLVAIKPQAVLCHILLLLLVLAVMEMLATDVIRRVAVIVIIYMNAMLPVTAGTGRRQPVKLLGRGATVDGRVSSNSRGRDGAVRAARGQRAGVRERSAIAGRQWWTVLSCGLAGEL